jgi:phospholipid transport system substrate-binding protein
VRTQLVLPQANPIEVQYHMHLKDGNWMAYDVKIDGISLVTNYRSSFSQEVRAVGMDGLIKKITTLNEKRVHKNETKNS